MPNEQRPLKVFLCHASADKLKVRELYRYLRRRGIKPWFDEMDLVGGQDWQVEIPKALATSDAIIICLTKNSVDKEGYIQKEIKFALDKALEMPEGRIFLIPVRFEECEVPFSLGRFQWVDLFDEAGYARMMRALKFRAAQLQRKTVDVPKKDSKEEKLALEKAAREKEELEFAEKTERETAEKIAQEKLEHEAAEKAKREETERDVAEKAAREKVQQEVNKIATREFSEQEPDEPLRKAAQEKAENQQRVYEEKTLPRVQLTPKQDLELKKHKLPRKLNRLIIIALIGLVGIIFAVAISSPLLIKLFAPQFAPTISPTFTPAPPSKSPALTSTLIPTSFSKSPTPSSTQTGPLAFPKGAAINCRLGPGTAWIVISGLDSGATSKIVGKTSDGGWWYIVDPFDSSRNCWVAATGTTTEGNVANIPVVEIPKASVSVQVSVDPAALSVEGCRGPILPIKIKGRLDVNGPAIVKWYFETQQGGAMPAQSAEFDSFGAKEVSMDYTPALAPGNYWVRLIVTSPDMVQEEVKYKIVCP